MNLRTGSFCTGICAPEVAWHPLGWTPQWFSEIDPFARAVESHRFPRVPQLGDMSKVNGADLRGKADVWVAGTPCQAFSVAGKRESLDDARGNLTLTFVELVHAGDPLAVVWENVPGVLNTRDNAFGCFLAGLVGEGEPLVCGDGGWPNAGMVAGPRRTAAWRVLDAQYFGLAQRRRRVFVVSFRTGDGHNPGAVLFEPESVQRNSAPRREAGTRVANSLTRGLGSGGADDNKAQAGWLMPQPVAMATGQAGSEISEGVCPTLNCDHEQPIVASPLTTNPYADNEAQDDRLVVTHSLRADGFDASEDGTGRGTPLVPVAFGWNKSQSQTMRVGDTTDALQASSTSNPAVAYQCHGNNVGEMGTIRGGNGGLTGGVPFLAQPVPFDTTQITSASNFSNPRPGDPCHPLAKGAHPPAVATIMAVRRLTPVECEKLQGFSPGYTDVPYRNKPAADGPRYRALGNSMAVPVLRWIGERIDKVLTARGVTLAIALLLALPSSAASFDLAPSPDLADYFRLSISTSSEATGVDFIFSTHGQPLTPAALVPGAAFPDVYPARPSPAGGASVDDVSVPLPPGRYMVADFQFPAGTDSVTVDGDVVGLAPLFLDAPATGTTLAIPEPGWGVVVAVWVAIWRAGRGSRK